MSATFHGAFSWLAEIELYTLQNCQPYEQSAATRYLVLTRYVSAAITLALFVFGIRNRELYLTLFSFLLTTDSLVNEILQNVIRAPVPVAGCGGPFGMPSFQVQHGACFVVFILTYGFIWPSSRHGYGLYTAALALWLAVVAYAHVFFNYNTPAQVFVASAVGSLVAGVGQFFIWRYLWPRFPQLLAWRVFRWRNYTDTLCSYTVSDILGNGKTIAPARGAGNAPKFAPPPQTPPGT